MSRIGRKPVELPKDVTATLEGRKITVKGPRGELQRQLHQAMHVVVENGTVVVTRPSDEQEHKALHGLTRTLVANMVEGVERGFRKQLDIVGVGYRAEVRPYGLHLALGFSHPIEYRAPKGIKLTAPQPTTVVIEGADKEMVGQVAAEIRGLRPPEPYKGKGIKYSDEQVRRKAGKAGGK
jgi:ribosomal protein L6, bacterial type